MELKGGNGTPDLLAAGLWCSGPTVVCGCGGGGRWCLGLVVIVVEVVCAPKVGW